MKNERNVGGMHCGEVLAELSDYLDGDLAAGRREQIAAHLKGCDICERFGGVFSQAIQSLRHCKPNDSQDGDPAFERLKVHLDHVTHRHEP